MCIERVVICTGGGVMCTGRGSVYREGVICTAVGNAYREGGNMHRRRQCVHKMGARAQEGAVCICREVMCAGGGSVYREWGHVP